MRTPVDVVFVLALVLPPLTLLIAAGVTLAALFVNRRARVRSDETRHRDPVALGRPVGS